MDDACELLIGYINRTVRDKQFDELVSYIIEVDAADQVEQLFSAIGAKGDVQFLDSVQRVYSVYAILGV
jgi:hypothetical protein